MIDKLFIKERLNKGLIMENIKKIVGGVLIKCTSTNRVLLLLRNDKVPVWALMSGGIEEGENVLDGLKREMYEELFIRATNVKFKFIGVEHTPKMDFHYYQGFVDTEFKPILDHENLAANWFELNELPLPLFKGLKEKIIDILK